MRKRKRPRANEGKNYHHRLAKVNGGSGKLCSGNLIQVDVLLHRAYHFLFGTKSPEEVAAILTKTWIDPKYEMIARKIEPKEGDTDDPTANRSTPER